MDGQTCNATACHSSVDFGYLSFSNGDAATASKKQQIFCGPLACLITDGRVSNAKDCLCGDSICSAGKFCGKSSRWISSKLVVTDKCRDIPSCKIKNGMIPNTNSCRCGDFLEGDSIWSQTCTAATGLHCFSDVVGNYNQPSLMCGPAPCSITDGSAANAEDCSCGTSICSAFTGRLCWKSLDMCADRPSCANSDATAINPSDCTCGNKHCTAATGRVCNAAANSCLKNINLGYSFVRIQSGRCSDYDHTEKITTESVCKAAAVSINRAGNIRTTKSSTSPLGCFYPQIGLKFNIYAFETSADCNAVAYAPRHNCTECSAGSTCICQLFVPLCPFVTGNTANLFACRCGTTPCQPSNGLVCTAKINQCAYSPLCTNTLGLKPNENVCKCGSKECTPGSGLVCTSSSSACHRSPTCTHTNGTTPNNGTCSCGPFVDCMARSGLYCDIEKRECGCPPGHVTDPLTETCRACLPGRFAASSMTLNSCAACPKGKYQNSSGATFCRDCQAGKHSATLGSIDCSVCNIGHEHVDVFTACSICLGGAFQPSNSTNHVKCALCPSGYYNADQGTVRFGEKHAGCDRCPDGLISSAGAKYCAGCPIGWSTTFDLNVPCVKCPQGWKGSSNTNSSHLFCEACHKGEYQKQTGMPFCSPCSLGSYADTEGSPHCKECPGGWLQKKDHSTSSCTKSKP